MFGILLVIHIFLWVVAAVVVGLCAVNKDVEDNSDDSNDEADVVEGWDAHLVLFDAEAERPCGPPHDEEEHVVERDPQRHPQQLDGVHGQKVPDAPDGPAEKDDALHGREALDDVHDEAHNPYAEGEEHLVVKPVAGDVFFYGDVGTAKAYDAD